MRSSSSGSGEASSTAGCVNIFNGEAPPVATRLHSGVKPDAKQLTKSWKQILGNEIGNEVRSRAWCKRALLRIYANQERDEQLAASVTQRNGVGFVPADARLLSGIAEQLVGGRRLSPRQWEILYKRMPKYAGQLQRGM